MQIDIAYAIIAQSSEKQVKCYIAIYIYDDRIEGLVLRYASRDYQLPFLLDKKESASLHDQVMKKRSVLVISRDDATFPDDAFLKFTGFILNTLVIIPIIFGDQYYGNIVFFHPGIEQFRKSDIDVFEGLTQQLSSTIYRLRMVEEHQGAFTQQSLSLLERDRISEIVSELVHSLSNDLGLIEIFIKEIFEELGGQETINEFIQENLDNISKSISRALRSINSAKKISLGDALIEEPIVIQPKELLKEACNSIPFPPNIQVSPLEVQEDIFSIWGIRSLIIDILRNLILNAIQAMPSGGKLSLKARNEQNTISIEVSDTGIGIPSEQISRIFDLSFSTKENTGFGLWSALRNAHRNNGRLEVESKVGLGTTFILTLPKADATEQESETNVSSILIVDDDAAILQALPQTLRIRMRNTQIDVADSGKVALEQILKHDYDVVVSDIKMPGMNGIELLKKIQELRPEVPVLLITGHGERDLAIQALRNRAYDFIQKPIDRDYFIGSIKRAIHAHKSWLTLHPQKLTSESYIQHPHQEGLLRENNLS